MALTIASPKAFVFPSVLGTRLSRDGAFLRTRSGTPLPCTYFNRVWTFR